MFNVSTDAVNATHLRMSGVTLGSEYNNCTCSGAPTSHYPEVPVCACARAFTIELYIFSAPHYFYDREYMLNERKFSKQALYGFAFPKNKFGFGLLTDALTRGCEYFYTVTAGVRSDSETFICTGRASAAYRHIAMLYVVGPISAPYLLPVALETKMADARVEYKRVDLQSYEARNGVSLAQSFKYNFSFPLM